MSIFLLIGTLATRTPSNREKATTFLGPDRFPLPGAPGGVTIASAPTSDSDGSLARVNGAKWMDEVKQDIDKHLLAEHGSFTDQNGTRLEWRRLSPKSYTFSVRTARSHAPVTLTVNESTSNAAYVEWASGPEVNRLQQFGPDLHFIVNVPDCNKVVWIQYTRTLSQFFKDGKVVNSRTLGPEIDTGVPYPSQDELAPGRAVMNDNPGLKMRWGTPKEKTASRGIEQTEEIAGIPIASDYAKAFSRIKFWSYPICVTPNYSVLGHYEWGYDSTFDQHGPEVKFSISKPIWIGDFPVASRPSYPRRRTEHHHFHKYDDQ